jgi:hypothetical protein
MVKYTLERRSSLYDSCVKKKYINRVKEGFIVSVLVFMFQRHQKFSN